MEGRGRRRSGPQARERDVQPVLLQPLVACDVCSRIREVSLVVGKAASGLSWEKLLGLAGRWDESAGIQRLGYFLDLHDVELPANVRDRLRALITPGSKVHLGSRTEWGTRGHLVQPWDIIENVPREQLLETDRDRRRKRAFPRKPA
jgi:predicted transcriptional regulator of viral defense system